jgi:hypothetical protein
MLGHATLIALTAALAPGLGLAGVGLAHLAAGALSLVAGLWRLGRDLGVGLGDSAALLALATAAWAAAAAAGLAGATGLAPAAALGLAVATLTWWTLGAEEVAWIRRTLGR